MSQLLDEIKYAFSNIDEGKAWPVETVPGAAKGWLIREKNGGMIAALPTEYKGAFDEKFAGVHMRTSSKLIDDTDQKLIIIECNRYENREPFARICEDFLSAENGAEIAKNPKDWWRQWKELMGNARTQKSPYAVIGELLLLLRLIEAKQKPKWTGPVGGSHDIELDQVSLEVKSTTERVDEVVTISNQHQLSAGQNKKLYLALCRFEPNRGHFSINSLIRELIEAGCNGNLMEDQLRKLGYPEGRTSRDEQYDLLGAEVYEVNEDFPKIVAESFKGDTFPAGVIKLIYDISLANLNRVKLNNFISNTF